MTLLEWVLLIATALAVAAVDVATFALFLFGLHVAKVPAELEYEASATTPVFALLLETCGTCFGSTPIVIYLRGFIFFFTFLYKQEKPVL